MTALWSFDTSVRTAVSMATRVTEEAAVCGDSLPGITVSVTSLRSIWTSFHESGYFAPPHLYLCLLPTPLPPPHLSPPPYPPIPPSHPSILPPSYPSTSPTHPSPDLLLPLSPTSPVVIVERERLVIVDSFCLKSNYSHQDQEANRVNELSLWLGAS